MYVGVFSEKVYEKMPLKLIKLHSVSITTVTQTEKLVLCIAHNYCMHVCMVCTPVCMCVHLYVCVYLYSMIVTGDAAGCVKFFDNDLKMLNWYVCTILGTHAIEWSLLFLLGTII